jgi:hypothetical protein
MTIRLYLGTYYCESGRTLHWAADEVAVALDPTTGALFKVGPAEGVQRWVADARKRWGDLFPIAVISGKLDPDDLNKVQEGSGQVLEFWRKANVDAHGRDEGKR